MIGVLYVIDGGNTAAVVRKPRYRANKRVHEIAPNREGVKAVYYRRVFSRSIA